MQNQEHEKFDVENKLKRIEEIVFSLENEDVPFDVAIKRYNEGIELIHQVEEYLQNVKENLHIISKDQAGRLHTGPIAKEEIFRQNGMES